MRCSTQIYLVQNKKYEKLNVSTISRSRTDISRSIGQANQLAHPEFSRANVFADTLKRQGGSQSSPYWTQRLYKTGILFTTTPVDTDYTYTYYYSKHMLHCNSLCYYYTLLALSKEKVCCGCRTVEEHPMQNSSRSLASKIKIGVFFPNQRSPALIRNTSRWFDDQAKQKLKLNNFLGRQHSDNVLFLYYITEDTGIIFEQFQVHKIYRDPKTVPIYWD